MEVLLFGTVDFNEKRVDFVTSVRDNRTVDDVVIIFEKAVVQGPVTRIRILKNSKISSVTPYNHQEHATVLVNGMVKLPKGSLIGMDYPCKVNVEVNDRVEVAMFNISGEVSLASVWITVAGEALTYPQVRVWTGVSS